MFRFNYKNAEQKRQVAMGLLATLAVLLSSMSFAHAQPGMDMMQNMSPAEMRQIMSQFPGLSTGCVDKIVDQMSSCRSYFGDLNELFPDIQAANGNELLSYVMNNRAQGACCEAIGSYNSARCICEQGILPMARQFPDRYWGIMEAGRCPAMTGVVITPQMC